MTTIATTNPDRAHAMAQDLQDRGFTAHVREANLPMKGATHEVRLRIPDTVPQARTYDWLDALQDTLRRSHPK